MECPCRDCTKRKVTIEYNCHKECEAFLLWKKWDRERARRERNTRRDNYENILQSKEVNYANRKKLKNR